MTQADDIAALDDRLSKLERAFQNSLDHQAVTAGAAGGDLAGIVFENTMDLSPVFIAPATVTGISVQKGQALSEDPHNPNGEPILVEGNIVVLHTAGGVSFKVLGDPHEIAAALGLAEAPPPEPARNAKDAPRGRA